MNQRYAYVIAILVMMFSQFLSYAQVRNCASTHAHQHQLEHNQEYRQKREKIHLHTNEYVKNAKDEGERAASVTIPVVFHIVWRKNFPAENISDAQIQSQMDILNKDFRRLNTDAANTPAEFLQVAADCEINFCLAKRTPTGASTTGINRVQSSRTTVWGTNDEVKKTSYGGVTPWNPTKYLNIYVCSIGGGVLGYSLFPGAPLDLDAVVIDYKAIGNQGTAVVPFNLGRTATHEVGHWLDLYHIWGDANCGNDYVTDTPLHNGSNTGCPSYPKYNNCSGNAEMTSNFMDYSDDRCMNVFSKGQKNRMQALFVAGGERVGLLTSDGCMPVSTVVGATCNAPSNVIVSSTGYASWTAVSGVSSYNFKYKPVTSATWVTGNTVNSNVNLTNLAAGTSYNFEVASVCTGAISTATTSQFATLQAACVAPTSISTSFTSTNSTIVSWIGATNSVSYNYRYKPATIASATWVTGSTAQKSVSLSNLIAGTKYLFEVSSTCTGAVSAFTSGEFTTSNPPCAAPATLNFSNATSSSLTATWAAVAGASSYTYRYKLSTLSTWKTGTTVTNSVLLSGLDAGSAYTFEVASYCSANSVSSYKTGQYSTLNVTTPTCASPTSISATNIVSNGAKINWTAVTGASSYTISYKTSAGTTWSSAIANSNSYVIINLANNTSYDVKVQTNCTTALSTSVATITFKTATVSCGKVPTGLTLSAVTGGKARASWSVVTGVNEYKIQYRKAGTTTWTVISSIFKTFHDIINLTPSTNYELQVAAVCSAGVTSPFSTLKKFKTTNQTACTDIYESNETLAAAKVLTVGTSITANISTLLDQDWFKIANTAAKPNIQLTLSNINTNYVIELYNANNQLVASGNMLGTGVKILRFNTTVIGNYYIKVSTTNGYSNALDCYYMKIETSTNPYGTNIGARMGDFEEKMNVYPNPAQEVTNIQIFSENDRIANLMVSDLTGRIVAKKEVSLQSGENNLELEVNNYQNGLYHIILFYEEKQMVKKLVVQKF